MIDRLHLKNFKCFEDLQIEMSNLNVFAGINSTGKSSVIQSLLLLRQAYEMGAIDKGLHLNGDIVNIGIGYDLMYRASQRDEIEIGLSINENTYNWVYNYERDSDFQKLNGEIIDYTKINEINLFQPFFSYVSAERIGPQRIYTKSYYKVIENNQVGVKGELFADYIAERGLKDKVQNESVLHHSIENTYLLYQAQAWLSEISPGIDFNTESFREAGLLRLEYVTANTITKESFSPLNVGFGLSYVAPIIVALLKAKPGDIVIIENPEAHLHPRGQRKMGELISKACAGGVQVVLETHSDHLLNGIRLSVKKKNLDRNLVRLNYFYSEYEEGNVFHYKCSPQILENGSLSNWPDGFFDEWEKALDELF